MGLCFVHGLPDQFRDIQNANAGLGLACRLKQGAFALLAGRDDGRRPRVYGLSQPLQRSTTQSWAPTQLLSEGEAGRSLGVSAGLLLERPIHTKRDTLIAAQNRMAVLCVQSAAAVNTTYRAQDAPPSIPPAEAGGKKRCLPSFAEALESHRFPILPPCAGVRVSSSPLC